MRELSEAKLFLCACYSHALFAQRVGRELHLDYFISYQPEEFDRVEDFYIQLPLSKNDRLSQRMLKLIDIEDSFANFDINLEIECAMEDATIIKKYILSVSKTHLVYNLSLVRTDLTADDNVFVWEWNAYQDRWVELCLFIEQMEDELSDELYS